MRGTIIALAFAGIVLVAAFPAKAQSTGDAGQDNRDAIVELLRMTGTGQLMEQMMVLIQNEVTAVIRQANPSIPDEALAAIHEESTAALRENLGTFLNATVALYAKHFSPEDIQAMTDFYRTPAGQKTIRVMPQLLQESMMLGQQWVQAVGPVVRERVRARLKKDGYNL